jgi:hypothetical protein
MRFTLALLTTALVMTACADGPSPAAPVARPAPVSHVTAPTQAPSAPPAVTSEGSVVNAELIKKAASVGYFPRTRKGVAVFCRNDADIGTRIPTEKCIGEAALAETVARMIEAKENLRKGEMCSSAKCSGN